MFKISKTKSSMFSNIIYIAFMVFFLISALKGNVFAQDVDTCIDPDTGNFINCPSTTNCSGLFNCLENVGVPNLNTKFSSGEGFIGLLITAILPIVLSIAGFIAAIFIIISGIQFISSGGNPEAAAQARGRLIYAIIGFVIIILSFVILQIVDKIFLGSTGIV